VLLVVDRGDGTGNRQPIERIGIETVLDSFERLDQFMMADRIADTQPSQRTRLRKGVHDQQVRVMIDQRKRRLATEVDVRLIDDDDRSVMRQEQTLDCREWQQTTRRRIRVRENDAAVCCRVIFAADFEILVERHGHMSDSIQATVDRVEAVSDIREENRQLVFEQRHEDMRQHFVGTVADEDLLR
jgi:hypothetical protein